MSEKTKNTQDRSIEELQAEVDELVAIISKAELGQCARLLATYVALYKHEFGELSQERFNDLSRRLSSSLEFGEAVYATGLNELLETLSIVDNRMLDVHGGEPGARTLN